MDLAILLILILLNGVFAMPEIARVTARKARLQARAAEGDGAAQAAKRLGEDPTRFLSTIQTGITPIACSTESSVKLPWRDHSPRLCAKPAHPSRTPAMRRPRWLFS